MTVTSVAPQTPRPTCEYEFHPLAGIFPLIEGDEFDALVEDVRKHGILSAITLHEGKIVEGRNRYRAAQTANHKFTSKDFVDLPPGIDPLEFVLSSNLKRRHLDGAAKKRIVVQLLRERPQESDRRIALMVGVSNKTVSTYRQEIEEAYENLCRAWNDLDRPRQRVFVQEHRAEIERLVRV